MSSILPKNEQRKQVDLHSMARANLNKSVWLVTNTTTASKYIPNRTRICIYWNPLFQTQIYLVKVPLNVNIVKQDLLNKKQFYEVRSERGISINTDSGPLGYVLWCCGSRSQDFFTFIQIGSIAILCFYYLQNEKSDFSFFRTKY